MDHVFAYGPRNATYSVNMATGAVEVFGLFGPLDTTVIGAVDVDQPIGAAIDAACEVLRAGGWPRKR